MYLSFIYDVNIFYSLEFKSYDTGAFIAKLLLKVSENQISYSLN